jgi:hypothetical protein
MKAATKSPAAAAQSAALAMPAIGSAWPGIDGKYAGIARGEDGEADHHLVLLNVRPASMKWAEAMAEAQRLGADLPTRSESALLYAHLRDEFDGGWHWTKTQYSSVNAWHQLFFNGTQGPYGKEFKGLFRPVRRLALQSFNPSNATQPSGDVLQDILREIKGARADVREIFLADTGASA